MHRRFSVLLVFALTACSDDSEKKPAEQELSFPVTESLQQECLQLRQQAQRYHDDLGSWRSEHEIIDFSFVGRTDNSEYLGDVDYEGLSNVTALRNETQRNGSQWIIASITAGDYNVELRFDAQNQALAQRLTKDATPWISFQIKYDIGIRVRSWKLKSAEGELWAMFVNQGWNWDFGKDDKHNRVWPQNELKGHFFPDLTRLGPFFEAEGFSISIDALDSEDACGVESITCLEGPAHFLPVTLTADGRNYTHLYGCETIEKSGLRYRLNLIEASTDAGTVMNCSDVIDDNHLHLLIALEE